MDHQVVFNILVGVLIGGGAWFARELWGATKELRKSIHDLEVDLPKTYVAKDDFGDAMKELKTQITEGFNRIHDKLDGKADK